MDLLTQNTPQYVSNKESVLIRTVIFSYGNIQYITVYDRDACLFNMKACL